MKKATTTRKPEIQSAAIYRCTDKVSHEVYYLVNSDSADTCYKVTWNEKALAWQCCCPATKPCKHERAVQEVENIRTRNAALAKAQAESAELLARIEVEVLASIEAEKALPDRPKSEQAVIGELLDAPVAPASQSVVTPVVKAHAFAELKNRFDYRATSEQRQSAPLQRQEGFSLMR